MADARMGGTAGAWIEECFYHLRFRIRDLRALNRHDMGDGLAIDFARVDWMYSHSLGFALFYSNPLKFQRYLTQIFSIDRLTSIYVAIYCRAGDDGACRDCVGRMNRPFGE